MRKVRPWQNRGRVAHFEHPLLSLTTRDLEAENGDTRQALVVEVPEWVNMIALDDDRNVLLVQQWRYGVAAPTLEIPGGMVDPGESPAEAARRELLEETGYRARHWTRLGVVEPNPAIFDNRCTTFLAESIERVGDPIGDGEEEIEVTTLPLAEIPARILSGDIAHALVVAAFYLHQNREAQRRR